MVITNPGGANDNYTHPENGILKVKMRCMVEALSFTMQNCSKLFKTIQNEQFCSLLNSFDHFCQKLVFLVFVAQNWDPG